jgi:hypothetical protein
MKKTFYFLFMTFIALSVFAGWQDWIPGYSSNQPKPKTLEHLLHDPELNKECYNERVLIANRAEYPLLSTCTLFKNMQKNIHKAQEIETHLSKKRALADKKITLEQKLKELKNEKYKKVAAYTALFGGSASISRLILNSLFAPRSRKYTGIATWLGFGAIAGFTAGTWRTAHKEQATKEELINVMKQQ